MQVGCEWAHQTFPDAKLYGTARHKQKFPNLPWESGLMEETSTQVCIDYSWLRRGCACVESHNFGTPLQAG